ncbi:MAG: M56 family metallopeptidase [Flavobacteriaceae bacterium]|nr:M56 family metallopeptidase [Flavobacteriaceae bacterium]
MGIYILKSVLCFAILLAFYKVALEPMSIHKFKRFYLLAIFPCALIIPWLTFTTYVQLNSDYETLASNDAAIYLIDTIPEESNGSNDLTIILCSIYILGAVIFLFKFCLNLYKIISKIKTHLNIKTGPFFNVLIHKLSVPHTFFYYIFLNKEAFEHDQIPKAVLLHEETHARQLHSIDILLIELFQIIFWFNPLIYFYKKSTKLNHEFLADTAVLAEGISRPEYQKTILAFASNTYFPLANAINYSSIKTRFIVMKTQSSKHSIWLKITLLFPLLAIMLLSFSNKKEAVNTFKSSHNREIHFNDTARNINIEILKDGAYLIDDVTRVERTNFRSVITTMHQDIAAEMRNKILNIHVVSKYKISHSDIWFIYNALLDYGFYRMVTENQEIIKVKGNTPIKEKQFYSTQANAISTYNNMDKNNMIVLSKDVVHLKYLYHLMSYKQRQNAEPFPYFPEPPPIPNTSNTINFPPPPPPIPENASPLEKEKYNVVIAEYDTWYKKHVHSAANTITGEDIKGVINDEIHQNPAPPLPPKSQLDFVIAMTKKNGIFYFDGKHISSDEAIKALKNDQNLNIATQTQHSNTPKIYISTQPITENKKGELVTKPKPIDEVKSDLNEDDQGHVSINGRNYFYTIRNKEIKYFDRWGQRVDETGKLIESTTAHKHSKHPKTKD